MGIFDKVLRSGEGKKVKALAGRYLKPTAMTYVIVGDAATQAKRLEALGFGPPVMLNEELKRVQE